MDPFLSYIIIYLSESLLALPAFLYLSFKRANKRKRKVTERILIGYYFSLKLPPSVPISQGKYADSPDAIELLNDHADNFLKSIKDNFWINLSEYSKNSYQRCEEFDAYKAGLMELCFILEYEVQRYINVVGYKHNDDVILKENVINETVDVLLFATCYRTLEIQLNLIDRNKAKEIFEFCNDNLTFLDAKYSNILEMNSNISGIRRTESK